MRITKTAGDMEAEYRAYMEAHKHLLPKPRLQPLLSQDYDIVVLEEGDESEKAGRVVRKPKIEPPKPIEPKPEPRPMEPPRDYRRAPTYQPLDLPNVATRSSPTATPQNRTTSPLPRRQQAL